MSRMAMAVDVSDRLQAISSFLLEMITKVRVMVTADMLGGARICKILHLQDCVVGGFCEALCLSILACCRQIVYCAM